jgi:hypothetical protein
VADLVSDRGAGAIDPGGRGAGASRAGGVAAAQERAGQDEPGRRDGDGAARRGRRERSG